MFIAYPLFEGTYLPGRLIPTINNSNPVSKRFSGVAKEKRASKARK